jgi:hypothetical protein
VPTTSRLALPYPSDDDPNDVAGDLLDLATKLDTDAAADGQGLASARPAAGVRGRYYWATDTKTLSRDDGTTWRVVYGLTEELKTVGTATIGVNASGATGTAVQIGDFGANEAYIKAIGSATNVSLVLMTKGTASGTGSAVFFQNSGGETSAYFSNKSGVVDRETTLVLGTQLSNTFTLKRVTMDEENSAGTGYRALRVPN